MEKKKKKKVLIGCEKPSCDDSQWVMI